jgi:hypothetical protein
MTEKTKAIQLIDKFDQATEYILPSRFAKKCAIIAAEEMIKETGSKYWYDVKREIEEYDYKR